MTPVASIIIPIAPEHAALAARAMASAAAQTLPCEVIPIVDDERRGAGYARNRGIEQATTDYLVFLDADDLLMPTFVERCYALHQQTNRYIYTDFLDDSGKRHHAPDCAWMYAKDEPFSPDPMHKAHAVTAFVPTAWARAVDGFDEDMTGAEDSEFFIHLVTDGYCGARLPEALFVYTNAPDGRSKRWRRNGGLAQYERLIRERYTEKGKAVACCTEPATPMETVDSAAPGKVLARPRWGGNHRERGQMTGTLYPNADKEQLLEVDPRDAAARPDRWEVIVVQRPPEPPAYAPVPQAALTPDPALQDLARRALQIKPPPYQPPPPPPPAEIVPGVPNVERVTRLAQRLSPPPIKSNNGGWREDAGASYYVPDAPATVKALDALNTEVYTPYQEQPARVYGAPTIRRTGDPVFVFPDKDYASYTDVRRLVELSGFEGYRWSESPSNDGRIYIHLSPEQPAQISHQDFSRQIWWTLEYGGEYEPDLSNWQGQLWASDPAWAKAHDAKLVVMGSHAGLAPSNTAPQKQYDYLTLAYQTPRRSEIDRQLADLKSPQNPYPGYGAERVGQLVNSKLMLHVHQREDTRAIAPQRIALAAAYKLPLICESVVEAGEYDKWISFIPYDNLNAEVRSTLAMYDMGSVQERGNMLHNWLCHEHTFRKSVEQALKS